MLLALCAPGLAWAQAADPVVRPFAGLPGGDPFRLAQAPPAPAAPPMTEGVGGQRPPAEDSPTQATQPGTPAAPPPAPIARPPSRSIPAAPTLTSATPPAAAALPTPNATVRLIELLIQNGVLTRDQAQALLRQAQAEATAPTRGVRAVTPPPPLVEPGAAPVPQGTVRVAFVPEIVRNQIRDDVRNDVLATARAEGWGRPGQIPEWSQRFRLYGDLRVRGEATTLPSNNSNDFLFPNFQSINNGSGFDVNDANQNLPPTLNLSEDRTRVRLRARLGVEARVNDWITANVQLATGNDGSPVSTNQTFGQVNAATGQFGYFSKYNIWVDRAYARLQPYEWLTVDIGRMPNPFVSTDLIYDVDLNFDGVAARFRRRLANSVTGFATVGAFPYFNTDFNFGSGPAQVFKEESRDRYLAAIQGGVDWRIAPRWDFQFAAAYYNFLDAQGKLSSPCFNSTAADSCDTDNTRAFFTQNTNTFTAIRNGVPRTSNPDEANLQLFGLASRFRVLDLNARLDITRFDPYSILLEANYLQNLGFSRSRIVGSRFGVSNNVRGSDLAFVGGDKGYMLRATVGHRDAETRLWAWNLFFAYRYLESDAVLDAFTDSDFRLGGTNSKGIIVGGTLGVARNTAVRARWLSGEEVSGPPYRADVLQLDLLARF